jgi:hypothetical protein
MQIDPLEIPSFKNPRLGEDVFKVLTTNPYHSELVDFFNLIENKIPWSQTEPTRQSGLQLLSDSNDEDFLASCGPLRQLKKAEKKFDRLAPVYSGTVIDELITYLNLPIVRLRWMKLSPKSCYSLHCDLTPRVHIPVITNPGAYFLFANLGLIKMDVGKFYLVDTRHEHTFINSGDSPRVHLVGALA